MCAFLSILASIVLAAPLVENPKPDFSTIGSTVRTLSLEKVKPRFVDEPPGQLRAIDFELTNGKIITRIRLCLAIPNEYNSGKRDWTIERLKNATVAQIIITPNYEE